MDINLDLFEKKKIIIYFFIFLFVIFSIYPWVNYLAGDTVIHMIFAENASNGLWFYFNSNNFSEGETSPIYMLWLTALYVIFPASLIPYIIQLFSIIIFFLSLLLFFKINFKISNNFSWTVIIFLSFGLMPGVTRNAILGMENIYATLIILSLIYLIISKKLFQKINSYKYEFFLSFLCGISLCFRPDTIVIIFFIVLFRALSFILKRKYKEFILIFLYGQLTLLTYYLSIIFYYINTDGLLPFSGGLARSNLSVASGIDINGLIINLKIMIRWFAYFPILLGFLYCSVLLFRLCKRNFFVLFSNNHFVLALVLFSSISAYIFIYTLAIFPSGHLSRYLIYYWYLVAIFISLVINNLYVKFKWNKSTNKFFLFFILCLFIINISEYIARYQVLSPGHKLYDLSKAVKNRKNQTDNLITSLNVNENISYPIKVAVVEVQKKYWWDNRVEVVSLDGILDSSLKDYFKNGNYDHFSYLKDKKTDYILEFPNYNKNKSSPSLKDLQNYQINELGNIGNFYFMKVFNDIVKIIY